MKILIVTALMAIAVAGCGGGEESSGADDVQETAESPAEGVVGTWEVAEVIEGTDIGNTGTFYTYSDDGTMQSGSGAMTIEGTWEISGDTLKQVIGGVNMNVLHSIDGDEMVYDIINGEQTFRLVRQ